MQTSALHAVDRNRVLGKATVRAAQGLGLSRKALGEVIGVSESTVYRIAKAVIGIDPEGKCGELALLLVRTFRCLDVLVDGDEDKRKLWMSTRNRELNNVPKELVKKVDGLLRVFVYLEVMRQTNCKWG